MGWTKSEFSGSELKAGLMMLSTSDQSDRGCGWCWHAEFKGIYAREEIKAAGGFATEDDAKNAAVKWARGFALDVLGATKDATADSHPEAAEIAEPTDDEPLDSAIEAQARNTTDNYFIHRVVSEYVDNPFVVYRTRDRARMGDFHTRLAASAWIVDQAEEKRADRGRVRRRAGGGGGVMADPYERAKSAFIELAREKWGANSDSIDVQYIGFGSDMHKLRYGAHVGPIVCRDNFGRTVIAGRWEEIEVTR
jgi:hypothetical protein